MGKENTSISSVPNAKEKLSSLMDTFYELAMDEDRKILDRIESAKACVVLATALTKGGDGDGSLGKPDGSPATVDTRESSDTLGRLLGLEEKSKGSSEGS